LGTKQLALERYELLLNPYPTFLVSCQGREGEPNALAVAWIIPVSVKPSILVMSLRPERHSHDLILETGEFVVNVPPFGMAEEALFCGRRTGRKANKFDLPGMTPTPSRAVRAPRIAECVAFIECRVTRHETVGDHVLFFAEVVHVEAEEEILDPGMTYNLGRFKTLLTLGDERQFTTAVSPPIEPPIPSL
jgi:flavin reductase (DIM6/NTAB) family NADH-FMN oxidoreductase RutF